MKKKLSKLIPIITLLLFGNIPLNAQENFGKESENSCNCHSDTNPLFKACSFCGYVVQYDPCGNCTRIYRHKCNVRTDGKRRGNYSKATTECGWEVVHQVKVGAPVQFYVNNLNFLKYDFSAESSSISIESGNEGLFSTFLASIQAVPTGTAGKSYMSVPGSTLTCSFETKLKEDEETLRQFVNDKIKTLADSFLKYSNVSKDHCTGDCNGKNVITSLENFIKNNAKEDASYLAINPSGYLNGIRRTNFDFFYAQMKNLKDQIKSNPDKSCDNDKLSIEIDKIVLRYTTIDSGIGRFVNVLAKVFPLPDDEYQYNVPKVNNVDYLVFNLNLKGKDVTRNSRLNMKSEELRIPVSGGVRIDFTTGPFVNIFKDTQYDLRPDSTHSKTGSKIIANNRGAISHFGIATMLQVYSRLCPNVSIAPSIGIGLNTDLNYSFLGGVGVVVGREQRASLNLGYSCNFVKGLNTSINNVNQYVNAGYTLKTLTTYRDGFFISLCYNIGLASKTNSTQAVDNSSTASTTSGSGSGGGTPANGNGGGGGKGGASGK